MQVYLVWTSSDFSRCSLPVPDVTISLIIITDGEGQIHWSRTNEKHARIRSVPELGTRRSKGNKGRPTRAPRWMERDGKRVECSWRERERKRRINGVANDGRADKRDNQAGRDRTCALINQPNLSPLRLLCAPVHELDATSKPIRADFHRHEPSERVPRRQMVSLTLRPMIKVIHECKKIILTF